MSDNGRAFGPDEYDNALFDALCEIIGAKFKALVGASTTQGPQNRDYFIATFKKEAEDAITLYRAAVKAVVVRPQT